MKLLRLFIFLLLMTTAANAQKFSPQENDSKIKFVIKNFGLNVDGDFSGLRGFIIIDKKNIEKSEINFSVNSNSVNTNNKERDKHLKKETYFNVEKFPLISFISTNITKKIGLNKYLITGNLNIKGIIKRIEFETIISNKDSAILLRGGFQLSRRNFKIGDSSIVLSDVVKLNFVISCIEEAN